MSENELFLKYLKIAIVVAAYWIISITTVFVNKSLFSSSELNFDAPLFVTWFQCVVCCIICFSMGHLSKLLPKYISIPCKNPYTRENMKKVFPLSILFTLMIASNNLCLKHVDVGFYYIGRSLTTVFNVILSYLIIGQATSFRCIACCALIVAGFWLGVSEEQVAGSFSIIGTFYGVLGSLTICLYAIYTKRVLPLIDDQVWLLSYYNNAYSLILFIPLILINNEFNVIVNFEKLNELYFWLAMTIGGICGFAIGFVSTLQIQVTSPLSHNISGTAKACAQTVLAAYWFSESKQVLWWFSNFLILKASLLYARFKQLDMEKKYKKQTVS